MIFQDVWDRISEYLIMLCYVLMDTHKCLSMIPKLVCNRYKKYLKNVHLEKTKNKTYAIFFL